MTTASRSLLQSNNANGVLIFQTTGGQTKLPCGGDEIEEAGGGEGEERGDGDHVEADLVGRPWRWRRRLRRFPFLAVISAGVFRTPLTSAIELVDGRLEKGGKGPNLCKKRLLVLDPFVKVKRNVNGRTVETRKWDRISPSCSDGGKLST